MTPGSAFKLNNFDLIRLFAATEVALHHALFHLEVPDNLLTRTLQLAPGVPIFFFVSGFLISRSYESNGRLAEYALNRILRIYPALILCTVLAIASVYATGYLDGREPSPGQVLVWIASQITILQFYPPEFMRAFGSGVLNGSLWTITVELQFYVLVPLLYWAIARGKDPDRTLNLALPVLILVFLVTNALFHSLLDDRPGSLAVKLLRVSFLPWFYMFLTGVLAQRHFKQLQRMLAGKAVILLPAYLLIAWTAIELLGARGGNQLNPALFALLALTVFACAYSNSGLATAMLRHNDISYGVYIYHMPVINVMLFLGLMASATYVATALTVTAMLAMTSWVLVERPALRLKRHPLFATDGRDA